MRRSQYEVGKPSKSGLYASAASQFVEPEKKGEALEHFRETFATAIHSTRDATPSEVAHYEEKYDHLRKSGRIATAKEKRMRLDHFEEEGKNYATHLDNMQILSGMSSSDGTKDDYRFKKAFLEDSNGVFLDMITPFKIVEGEQLALVRKMLEEASFSSMESYDGVQDRIRHSPLGSIDSRHYELYRKLRKVGVPEFFAIRPEESIPPITDTRAGELILVTVGIFQQDPDETGLTEYRGELSTLGFDMEVPDGSSFKMKVAVNLDGELDYSLPLPLGHQIKNVHPSGPLAILEVTSPWPIFSIASSRVALFTDANPMPSSLEHRSYGPWDHPDYEGKIRIVTQ